MKFCEVVIAFFLTLDSVDKRLTVNISEVLTATWHLKYYLREQLTIPVQTGSLLAVCSTNYSKGLSIIYNSYSLVNVYSKIVLMELCITFHYFLHNKVY